MIPISRLSNKNKVEDKSIIKIVERYRHQAWHALFNNLTPYEVCLFIILRLAPHQFIKGKIKAVWENNSYYFRLGKKIDEKTKRNIELLKINKNFKRYLKFLFSDRDWCNIIATIVEEWSPNNYFRYVDVKIKKADKTIIAYKKIS